MNIQLIPYKCTDHIFNTVCAEPADVVNAMYTVEMLNSNYTVIYKCHDEFNLLGNGVIECQSDGNWTDHNFICTSKYLCKENTNTDKIFVMFFLYIEPLLKE